jgi:hypothetical protein
MALVLMPFWPNSGVMAYPFTKNTAASSFAIRAAKL